MKKNKLKFKRGRGGDGGWGAGLDYLLKPYWDDLDTLTEHNYFGRHDEKLINRLFDEIKIVLSMAILEMKKLCKNGSGLNDWIRKERKIQNLGKLSKKENEKVIFIDTAVQFLRATTTGPRKKVIRKAEIMILGKEKIIGTVACASVKRIKGYARIIKKNKDFNKFKNGEILITQETNPDFFPIMKKAKAFITNEGGVLCHAAIAARELKKPCIVDTKNATKIIKNRDLIEMNLESGEIKILN